MTIGLIILKLIMLVILLGGPIMVGRQLAQAARGRALEAKPAAVAAAEAEEAA